jgi:hypothetical protein
VRLELGLEQLQHQLSIEISVAHDEYVPEGPRGQVR